MYSTACCTFDSTVCSTFDCTAAVHSTAFKSLVCNTYEEVRYTHARYRGDDLEARRKRNGEDVSGQDRHSDLDDVFSPKALKEWLGPSTRTWQKWRHDGTGPKYSRLSHTIVVYKKSDVLAWLAKNRFGSTSEESRYSGESA